MNPAKIFKNFSCFLFFLVLAGFSSASFSQSMELRIWPDFSGGVAYEQRFYFPVGTSHIEALNSLLPFSTDGFAYTLTSWTSYGNGGCSIQTAGGLNEIDGYYSFRYRYCSSSLPPDGDPEPEPEPEPLEPDDPYCLDDPLNPLCSPEEPTPFECENGVGSEACCASYAYKACEPKSVAWWSPGYGLGGYVTSCSYSCGDSYTPPDPDIPDPTAPSPVNPVNPSNPATPSDPSDPVSVDLSGVNERLDILANLNSDGFNALNDSIYKLDRNNQVGLENVRRSVNAGFGDLASRLNPSGAPTFDPNAFAGLDGFTDADSDEMKALLGITGDESYSDLERTINLDDYVDDYTFTLPDATCPAPRQLGLSFGTFELNYEPVCEIFGFLGNLVVLTALFLTPIIIFRGL